MTRDRAYVLCGAGADGICTCRRAHRPCLWRAVSELQLGMRFIANVTIGNMPFAMCSTVSLNTGSVIRELIQSLRSSSRCDCGRRGSCADQHVPAWFGFN